MKRTALKRGKPLRSSGKGLKRSKLKRVNAARQDKRRAAYSAYLRSKVWKFLRAEALERAGHQCERIVERQQWLVEKADGAFSLEDTLVRCSETALLQVHHMRYPKVLGSESVDTLRVLCKRHHEQSHALNDWWKPRGRRA